MNSGLKHFGLGVLNSFRRFWRSPEKASARHLASHAVHVIVSMFCKYVSYDSCWAFEGIGVGYRCGGADADSSVDCMFSSSKNMHTDMTVVNPLGYVQ